MEDSHRHPGKWMPATDATDTVGTTVVRALATNHHRIGSRPGLQTALPADRKAEREVQAWQPVPRMTMSAFLRGVGTARGDNTALLDRPTDRFSCCPVTRAVRREPAYRCVPG